MEIIRSTEGYNLGLHHCEGLEIARLEERIVQVACLMLEKNKPWIHEPSGTKTVFAVISGKGKVENNDESEKIVPQTWIIVSPEEEIVFYPEENMHVIRVGHPINSFATRTPYVDF